MLHTFLTDTWGLRVPLLNAPMAGAAGGDMARAVTEAGGLGMIGVDSDSPTDFLEREADIAREGDPDRRFGFGLMAWALKGRPELLEAAISQRPFLLSISFGDPAPFVEKVHAAGIRLCTQVNSGAAARHAAGSGVDLIVAQGTEAGGHTGFVATLPLLQVVLGAVDVPVVAAGGIGSARGMAAALAAGAEGVWVGTALLACPEATNTPAKRRQVLNASETDTVHTHLYDRIQHIPWPDQYPGRALRNAFSDEWEGREDDLLVNKAVLERYFAAKKAEDYDIANVYAGESAGLVTRERPAGEAVRDLCDGAERLLRERMTQLLEAP